MYVYYLRHFGDFGTLRLTLFMREEERNSVIYNQVFRIGEENQKVQSSFSDKNPGLMFEVADDQLIFDAIERNKIGVVSNNEIENIVKYNVLENPGFSKTTLLARETIKLHKFYHLPRFTQKTNQERKFHRNKLDYDLVFLVIEDIFDESSFADFINKRYKQLKLLHSKIEDIHKVAIKNQNTVDGNANGNRFLK